MKPEGNLIIGQALVKSAGTPFFAVNPATDERLEPGYPEAGEEEFDRACALAEQAATLEELS